MKKHIWYFFVLFNLFAIFLISSCKKDNNPSGPDNTNNPPAQNYALLLGRVQNESGTLLGSVTVTIQGKTVQTNEQGWFSVSELTAGTKKQVSFSKSGYISTYKVVDVNNGQSSFIDATLATAPTSQTVANTGGTLTLNGGAVVTFPSGSFAETFSAIAINPADSIACLTKFRVGTSSSTQRTFEFFLSL
ncbi:MAG: carboxypeptidase regulatory-like domain-containing protein [Ignavibacteriales bacterium]|nr:MAG: carboxypeptidase regulatory-like domain-containing protein [Ignavibacteriales bacterium]